MTFTTLKLQSQSHTQGQHNICRKEQQKKTSSCFTHADDGLSQSSMPAENTFLPSLTETKLGKITIRIAGVITQDLQPIRAAEHNVKQMSFCVVLLRLCELSHTECLTFDWTFP